MVLDPATSELMKRLNRQVREQIDYKVKCPHCGAHVITYQLEKNGCFICGWRPKE